MSILGYLLKVIRDNEAIFFFLNNKSFIYKLNLVLLEKENSNREPYFGLYNLVFRSLISNV